MYIMLKASGATHPIQSDIAGTPPTPLWASVLDSCKVSRSWLAAGVGSAMKRRGLKPIRYGLLLFVFAAMTAEARRDGPS